MGFPKSAIFAFNANIDHLVSAGEAEVAKLDGAHPEIASAMSECFATGVQREAQIDARVCAHLLSNFKSVKIIGGQAGNAAEQASALGVDCFLHTNFANAELFGLFSRPEKILSPSGGKFVRAGQIDSQSAGARHFVFENAESRTRFICSYDPFPLHPDSAFCDLISPELPGIGKAFVGGLHLVKTPERARKFVSEIRRWKEINPSLSVFFEMGEFQSASVLEVARKELFPLADAVGLNEFELASTGCSPEELLEEAKALLLHSPEAQKIYPEGKENPAALSFARKCAAFKAKTGRCANAAEAEGYEEEFVDKPARTVGLGDTLSCAYFMAL